MLDQVLATIRKHYPDDDLSPVREAFAELEAVHRRGGEDEGAPGARVSGPGDARPSRPSAPPPRGSSAGSMASRGSSTGIPAPRPSGVSLALPSAGGVPAVGAGFALGAPPRGETSVRAALETAQIVAEVRLDPKAVTAALLARVALRDAAEISRCRERWGAEVAGLLEGVQRLASIRWDRIEEEEAESLRKLFLAMARDVRVVVIVLAMRVQTLRAIHARDAATAEGVVRFARETLEIFAPLANRLGIWQLKWELEDMALRVLDPDTYERLARGLAAQRQEREAFIEGVMATLREKLAAEGIDAKINGRPKHIYSIYKKMTRKDVPLDQIFDASAVRVICHKLTDCYAALGLVHSQWIPLPQEFDDYIAKPKENGYQSLHTAVVGPGGRPFEVQIRTAEMHQFAEYGVAAHWAYKERADVQSKQNEKFMVLRQLMNWEREVTDPHQFVESLKTDLFEDQVYVFTPNGDILDLPIGATPLDFAYRIHTEVGHRCRGARVNGHIQPLDYQLKTGDRVEILTQKKSQPSRDWMNPSFGFIKTTQARAKVRGWFREQARDTAIAEGRDIVTRELARLDITQVSHDDLAAKLEYPSVEDLFAAVGYGDRHPQGVGTAALGLDRARTPAPEVPFEVPSAPQPKRRSTSGLSMDGVDDILGNRARCCNPVPGDRVIGFVSRGRGIVIHRRDCVHVKSTEEPERLVEIDWGGSQGERHRVEIEIRARDRAGLLRDVSNLVAAEDVNVASARAEGTKDGAAWLRLTLDLKTAEQMVRVIQRIDTLPEVLEVRRVAR
ncbi:MAG: bifunctional (p)ppGpp synthetase/guanosine-3',5'-bis(diphosphate) 3'-pyrophosphohydrolase [Deltaproteobacteria bacterium]|nr:bifunctional (p)ppGpp synthetase/guanosine-3',5'-bis(diphosphate) 3'-pyrophosphohydrolase [Deltaproteobacteria bacterium]